MYPLLWLSCAWIAGLLLAAWLNLPLPAWAGLSAALLATSFFERRARTAARWRGVCPLPLTLVLAVLCAGSLRYAASREAFGPHHVAGFTGNTVVLQGWVAAPPEPGTGSVAVRVEVERLALAAPDGTTGDFQAARGRALARLPAGKFRYGDRIELTGLLEQPAELDGFSYRDTLAREDIYNQFAGGTESRLLAGQAGSRLLRWLYEGRLRAYAVSNQIFPRKDAALLNGILLGLDGDLPPALEEAFQLTGTAHIIAISGFNISLLAGLFFWLFRRGLSRWGALVGAILTTFLYTLFVGAEPPVVRAAIMGALVLFGREIGRRSAGATSLAFTAALMCLVEPDLPWSPSFQLSFGATLGMVCYAEPFQRAFQALARRYLPEATVKRLNGPVSDYLLTTLAAQVMTLPVMLIHFGRFSFISLLANPLVLPPQPPLMILAGLAVLAGMIWLPAGQVLAWVTWPFSTYTIHMVELLARAAGTGESLVEVGPVLGGLYYALLALLPVLRRRVKVKALWKPAAVVGALAVSAVLLWELASARPDGRLRLTVFHVEGRLPVLVETAGGRRYLLGAGSTPALGAELSARLPLFGRSLDGWVVTGRPGDLPDLLPLARETSPGWAAASRQGWQTQRGKKLDLYLLDEGVEAPELQAGQVLLLDRGARIVVLAASEQGTALLLEWGNFRALLPGGVDCAALPRAAPAVLLLEGGADKSGRGPCAAMGAQARVQPGAGGASEDGLVLLPEGGWLNVETDGAKMWLEVGE